MVALHIAIAFPSQIEPIIGFRVKPGHLDDKGSAASLGLSTTGSRTTPTLSTPMGSAVSPEVIVVSLCT